MKHISTSLAALCLVTVSFASRPDFIWMRGGNPFSILDVDLSNDGQYVAVANEVQVDIFRTSDGQLVKTLEPNEANGYTCRFSPNSSQLLAGGGSLGNVTFYSVPNFARVNGIQDQFDTGAPNLITYSPNGMSLTVDQTYSGKVYRTTDLSDVGFFWNGNPTTLGHTVGFVGDELLAYSPGNTGVLGAYDCSSGQFLRQISVYGRPVGSPDARFLSTYIGVLNYPDLSPRFSFGETIYYPFWSPTGSIVGGGLYNGGYLSTIAFWDAETGARLPDFNGHAFVTGEPPRLDFSQDGTTVASGVIDVLLWRFSDRQILQRFTQHTGISPRLAVSPDSTLVASGVSGTANATSNTVAIWDAQSGALLQTIPGQDVTGIVFTPDGQRLIFSHGGFNSGPLEVWKRNFDGTWSQESTLGTNTAWTTSLTVLPGNRVATTQDPGSPPQLYDIATGQSQYIPFYWASLCADPTSNTTGLVAGRQSGTGTQGIYSFELANPSNTALLLPTSDVGTALAASPNGRWIASISYNGQKVVLFDRTNWTQRTLETTTRAFNKVRFSPDSNVLMVCGFNGVEFYNPTTGALFEKYDIEVGANMNYEGISDGQFVGNGSRVVLGRWDGSVLMSNAPKQIPQAPRPPTRSFGF